MRLLAPIRPSLDRLLALGSALALLLALVIGPGAPAAFAARDTDSFDGNIFALYAGNGSLVPPRSTLEQSLAEHRPVVLAFYLDDSSVSKTFSPVLSELQRTWGNNVELIYLTTDNLQNRPDTGPSDPAHYWKGTIPQVVVIDANGTVVFDAAGQVNTDAIDAALAKATGRPAAQGPKGTVERSFNEFNSEITPAR
ncbi:thylakoid membrane photosystem I accumulation factor [Cyanobium sp. Morenito 9A2]|uniref:thylakoid membrane photosystem I accumulation factor n=1 Tax=Cyanobium sp. Morenito 9A2 TaxID=2823718 RepID=UPI0037BEF03F